MGFNRVIDRSIDHSFRFTEKSPLVRVYISSTLVMQGAIRLPYTVSAHIKSVTFMRKRSREQGGKGLKLISGDGGRAQSDKIPGRQSPGPP